MSFVVASVAIPVGNSNQHGPSWAGVLVSAIIVILAVTLAVKPQLQWKMNRWQFKNPTATEPSRAGLMMTRVTAGIVAAAALVFLVIAIGKL